MTVQLIKTEVTNGIYMGEEGIAYNFAEPDTDTTSMGDISWATRGHYQGYDELVSAELDSRLSLRLSRGGTHLAFASRPFRAEFAGEWIDVKPGYGLNADECITFGLLVITQ